MKSLRKRMEQAYLTPRYRLVEDAFQAGLVTESEVQERLMLEVFYARTGLSGAEARVANRRGEVPR